MSRRQPGSFVARSALLVLALGLGGCGGGLADGLYARMVTERGEVVIELHPEVAPLAVASFVGLTESAFTETRFYDGQIVDGVSGEHVQTGDPRSVGLALLRWSVPSELASANHDEDALRHDRPGVVSLYTEGAHTGNARFIITKSAVERFDRLYPAFGTVVSGQDVVDQLRRGDRIERIRIRRVGATARAYRVDQGSFVSQVQDAARELLAQNAVRDADVADRFRERFPEARATESGLLYAVHHAGSGATPDYGAAVQIRYIGSLADGTTFGATQEQPDEFVIGRVIGGLEEMLLQMRRGERRSVLIPPDLGYGTAGIPGTVPPNAHLIFDVELVDFAD